MDAGNLAALIFHEVIYALIPPEYCFGRRLSEVIIESDGSKREIYEKYKFLRQPSRPVRDIVAFLFSDDFVSNPSTLLRVSKGYLPMYSNKNRSRAKGKSRSNECDAEKLNGSARIFKRREKGASAKAVAFYQ